MPIVIPTPIAEKLANIESSLKPFDVFELFGELNQLVNNAKLNDDEQLGYQAEVLGFQFTPMRGNERSPWGGYFGPTFSRGSTPDEMVHIPNAKTISREVIEYWNARSIQTSHPILQARYADLALDIGHIWNYQNPDLKIQLAHELTWHAIDGYVHSIEANLSPSDHQTWVFLNRALDLSLYIHDKQRIAKVKSVAFAYVRNQTKTNESRSWWALDNLVWGKKGIDLSNAERNELIGWLEEALKISSNINDPNHFNPHDALSAADLLHRWYGKLKQPDLGIAAIQKAGAAFEKIATNTSALTAIAWLEDLSIRYKNIHQMEDVARVNATIKARSAEVDREMTHHEVKIEISKEELGQWLDSLFTQSLEISLGRIAVNLMYTPEKIKEMVEDSANNAPLQALIPITIMGVDGFTQAKIGSVTDDMAGRLIHMTSTLIGHSAPWLNFAFDHAKEKWQLDADKLFTWLTQSPLFTQNRYVLLRAGIDAWIAEEYAVAIHLLIPQIEAALREWLILMGESAMRPNQDSTGFEAIGMGAVLNTNAFKNKIHPMLRLHLDALFTNTKGLNLRNRLAHGIADPEILNRGMANWVIHALLVIRTFAHLKG